MQMDKKWKNREKPNLEHLMSLFGNSTMSAFINGHLIIESLLVQMIDLKLEKPDAFDAFSLNFPSKIKMCLSLGILDERITDFLLQLNTQRNKFAHQLGYKISFDDVFSLCEKAYEAGVDFSDDTIHSNRELSKEWYDTEGVIQEIFQNTAMDLSFYMEEIGGKFQFT